MMSDIRLTEYTLLRQNMLLSKEYKSTLSMITGDSGTGKSYLVKKAIDSIVQENLQGYICYIDISSDNMSSASVFEELLYCSWNELEYDQTHCIHIPHNASIANYLQMTKYKESAKDRILSAICKAVSLIPAYGSVLESAVTSPKSNCSESFQLDRLYVSYIKHLTKRMRVIVCIDNYQYAADGVRRKFEALVGSISNGITLILVDRTVDGKSTIRQPLCFGNNFDNLRLTTLTEIESKQLLENLYHDFPSAIARRIYRITQGNPKLIELAAQKYMLSVGQSIGVDTSLRELDRAICELPDIERYILIVCAFFPSGLRIKYIDNIISKLSVVSDDLLNQSLQALALYGYLTINSSRGDLVKPSHEKVVTAIRSLLDNEEYTDVYNTIVIDLEELLSCASHMDQHEHDYLLYCLVMMMSTGRVKSKLSFVIELIDRLWFQDLYGHITEIYQHMKDIVNLLPMSCFLKVLDSFQKTSNFYSGLEAIELYHEKNHEISLYSAKFLTQTYEFTQALSILNSLPVTTTTILYKANVYQHLYDNEASQELVQTAKRMNDKDSEAYAVLMRNTAHLFDYDTAIRNLEFSLQYFRDRGNQFAVATVLNNMGVVNIWQGCLDEAHGLLCESTDIFSSLGSNELFESLFDLSVLHALAGRMDEAIDYANRSLEILPTVLWMDVLVLKMNILIYELLAGKNTPEQAHIIMSRMVASALRAKDPWVKNCVLMNAAAISQLVGIEMRHLPDKKFVENVKSKAYTRFDVMISGSVGGHMCAFILPMSPNWRY